MSAKMTAEERAAFLAETHVGVIAVERAGRAPLAVPVWYSYEPGGDVLVWTDRDSVKDKLIRAAGRFTITAQVEEPPYRYASAEGPVVGYEDPAPVELKETIARRYMGDEGPAYVQEVSGNHSVVIRMRPEKWLGVDYRKQR